ncbi:hypothetical protein KFK09_020535 [Dendrobium nobile]|uniref:Uncharacterized protein n=1 Tax=Dendrobium nobile TaxID=94219 RepID=A0A8T3ANF6_DENNO|nr:hypothetical protein KFK09_020535 [Dendrobium nobile]
MKEAGRLGQVDKEASTPCNLRQGSANKRKSEREREKEVVQWLRVQSSIQACETESGKGRFQVTAGRRRRGISEIWPLAYASKSREKERDFLSGALRTKRKHERGISLSWLLRERDRHGGREEPRESSPPAAGFPGGF